MSRKTFPLTLIAAGIFLLMLAFLFRPTEQVSAQCKDPSSCRTCHEVQGQMSVRDLGDWHSQHAAFDFCAVCHLGDRKAQDAAAAHTGMTQELSQMADACKSCHAADFDARYNRYASQLGAGSADTVAKTGNTSALGKYLGQQPGVNLPGAQAAAPAQPAAAPAKIPGTNTGNVVLSVVLLALVLGGGGFVIWNERRINRKAASLNLWQWLLAQVRREHWSPYAAGVLLGVCGILAVTVANHLLGASGAISTLASTLLSATVPAAQENSMYYQYVMPPGLSWEVMLLVGIFFGGMLAALSSKTFRLRWNDDVKWNKIWGAQPWKRFVIGFLGAVILQYGAGIAGGCTSGLAISGGMLLAPSAFLFMGGMFASGILIALIVYRRKY